MLLIGGNIVDLLGLESTDSDGQRLGGLGEVRKSLVGLIDGIVACRTGGTVDGAEGNTIGSGGKDGIVIDRGIIISIINGINLLAITFAAAGSRPDDLPCLPPPPRAACSPSSSSRTAAASSGSR